MADKLIVENFGPITQRTELDIKKTTVFIGPQGSGKSTLAKLVRIFNDKNSYATLSNAYFTTNLFNDFGLSEHFNDSTILNFQSDFFNYAYQDNELLPLLSEKSNDETKKILTIDKHIRGEIGNFDDYNSFIHFLKRIPKGKVSNVKIIASQYIQGGLNFLMPKTIYVPTERFLISALSGAIWGLMNNNLALSKYITAFGSDFELAKNNHSQIKIDYLNVQYKHINGLDKVILKNNQEINLVNSASGFQSAIPLNLVIENNYKNELQNFIIEEPELNLYPITQKHLVQYLVEKCTFNKNQLLMTTHSPYVLSSLNLLIFAYQTAQKHPEQIEAIKAIVPQESWINPDEFAAYFVDEGTARSIISPKTGMIAENELDGVSDLIGDEFDALKRIYISKTYAAVN
jgi:predicted ATPase